jgi:pimeloyl-ACP methyl ester carboxylesterase
MTKFEWEPGETNFMEIDGVKLEAVCYGPAPQDAPTIIMLHEGLGCVALWRDFPQQIAAETGLGVFVYSRVGYGASDPFSLPRPLDYMHQEADLVLSKVLDEIGFQSGILLGHSDGASIAAIYAGTREDHRVRGLVLIAPHFFTEDVGLASIAEARDAYESGNLRDKLAKYHKDVDNAFLGWNGAWLDPKFRQWNISEVIDYWRIPVLVIQGREDQYGTLAQIDEIESRIYSPLDVVIIDDCKHSPYLEATDKVISVVGEFVERLSRMENEHVEIK